MYLTCLDLCPLLLFICFSSALPHICFFPSPCNENKFLAYHMVVCLTSSPTFGEKEENEEYVYWKVLLRFRHGLKHLEKALVRKMTPETLTSTLSMMIINLLKSLRWWSLNAESAFLLDAGKLPERTFPYRPMELNWHSVRMPVGLILTVQWKKNSGMDKSDNKAGKFAWWRQRLAKVCMLASQVIPQACQKLFLSTKPGIISEHHWAWPPNKTNQNTKATLSKGLQKHDGGLSTQTGDSGKEMRLIYCF